MHPFVTIILTAAMLVHATFGCCLHHAHACEVDCAGMTEADHHACDGHGHHHGRVDDAKSNLQNETGHEDSPDRDDLCESDKCNFARTEASLAGWALGAGDAPAILDQSAVYVAQCDHGVVTAPSFSPGPAFVKPRLHLALAVLQI